MSKKILYINILFLGLLMLMPFGKALAMTPTLSLSGTGDGDSVQISVSGDPNASVILFYIKTGSGQQLSPIGTTNASGNLAITVSTSSYGVAVGSTVYVTTGGVNGSQSATVAWPAVAAMLSASNMLTLSQTGLVLGVGQTATVTASNLNNSTLYQSANSNPQIANFSISGGTITVTANSYGSTTGTFCLINNTSNCGSIYVLVQNSSVAALTFSQSSVTLSAGQTVSIQISGGSGAYSVLSNASQNNGLVTTNISGSTITLTTTSTAGSSSITVCSTNMSSCGIINVTMGNTSSTTAVSFSQTNPTLTVGQSLNVTIFGPQSSFFYVNSNSAPSVVQPNISGTTLSLLGITNGTANINVCVSSSNCATLAVTVSPSSTSGSGKVTFSQDNVTLAVGQNLNVTVSGGAMPYTTLITPNNIFQATVNSNILTISGLSIGSSSMNVCSNGSCSSIVINVGNQSSTTTTLPAGCYSASGYSQTTGQSCSSLVSNPTPVLPADCLGTTQYSISTGILCTNYVAPTVTPAVSTTTVSNPAPTVSANFKFTKSLKLGSKGAEVTELQKKLKALGFYGGKLDGGFGSATEKAVKAFQKAHKLPQVGNVGPLTRALLNK